MNSPDAIESSTSESSFIPGFPFLVRAMVFTFALYQFSYIFADPDLWGHLTFGGDIVSAGAIHATDPYSYTARGHRWINHEWLTEVLFHSLYRLTNNTMPLLVFKLALGFFILVLLSNEVLKGKTGIRIYFLYAVIFFLAVSVIAPAFMMRPHLMTLLFLTLMILALYQYKDGHFHALARVPLIILAWVNCHGGVVAGLGLFGLFIIIELLRFLREGDKRWRWLVLYGGLACGAALINPYGYKLWLFFVESLGKDRPIGEWAPVNLLDGSHWQFKLLAIAFVATLFTRTKKRLWEVVLIGFALIYGFKHQRHTVLAAILLIPYLHRQGEAVWERWQWPPVRFEMTAVMRHGLRGALILFIGWQAFNIHSAHKLNGYQVLVEPHVYPTHLARFMNDNGIHGNLVVPFDWGEYFIWKQPESKVSIDGRFRTVYPEEIIELNWRFQQGEPGGDPLLTRFPTDAIIIRRRDGPQKQLDTSLHWEKIYQDPLSALYIPRTDPPGPLLQQFRAGTLKIDNALPPYQFPG